VRVDPKRNRIPLWQLALYAVAATASGVTHPIRRMWHSDHPLDRYALCHLTSAAGDSLLAISLADSVFFSLPVGQAKWRVVAYLGLTMLPLAVAGPLLVVPLDRAGPRRLISFLAAIVRAGIAFYVAGRLDTVALYPAALMILVAARVHGITKNGLTMAYAGPGEGLMRSNARLGRVAVAGALTAAPLGAAAVSIWGPGGAMVLAGIVYSICAFVTLRLPHPRVRAEPRPIGRRGRVPALTGPAIGAAGMRAATGFILFLSGFAIRREGFPATWFAAMAVSAAAGGFLADILAPRLPETLREEFIVVGCTVAAGLGAFLAFQAFSLPVLAIFTLTAGAATELGRLAFQSLMQQNAPEGALGRVFVRYEVVFQLSWVAGAVGPAVLPIDFKAGILIMAGFYLALAGAWAVRFFRGRAPVGTSSEVP
jgi:MFS transporter